MKAVKNIPPYAEIIKSIKIDDNRLMEVKTTCGTFTRNKGRYQFVGTACSFPIDLLFTLHYRESSLDFRAVLHNGERILGTGKKTKLVPENRGPFNTWEEAAIDAINLKKSFFPFKTNSNFTKYYTTEGWTFENKLIFAEIYNGLGYRNTKEYSPYVLAATNFHDETGKFWKDGKYKDDAPEKQLGVASLILGLNIDGLLV